MDQDAETYGLRIRAMRHQGEFAEEPKLAVDFLLTKNGCCLNERGKMTLEQAMGKCTWDFLSDAEKAVVEHYKAHRDDPAAKEAVGNILVLVAERRIALVAC